MNAKDLVNAIAHSNLDDKLHYIQMVDELDHKATKLDKLEDFLFNGLGWSKTYIENILESKNRIDCKEEIK